MDDIEIIDIIHHKNQYHTQVMLVLNRQPIFEYEKDGNWLIGEDSGFYNFYFYERPSKHFEAFAGREFDIKMESGEIIKANGQWWDGVPKKYQNLLHMASASENQLNKCNVFYSMHQNSNKVFDWLSKNKPSNNYRKYDPKSKDYGKHTIQSRFD